MQFHDGVYRSDDAGATWVDVGEGPAVRFRLPDRRRPGRPRQRLRDPARSAPRTGRPRRRGAGLGDARRRRHVDAARRRAPRDAYLTILREAFDTRGEGRALELYFGATSGEVFGSGDAGASWRRSAITSRRSTRCRTPETRGGRAAPRPPARLPASARRVVGMSVISPSAIFCSTFSRRATSCLLAFGLNVPSPTPSWSSPKSPFAAALERAVLHRLDRQEDGAVDALQRARQHVWPEERLVGVDADPPDASSPRAASSAPRPQPPATWKTTFEPAAIWFSASSLHFAWSSQSCE